MMAQLQGLRHFLLPHSTAEARESLELSNFEQSPKSQILQIGSCR
jgi:hypothetical protein